MTPPVAVEPTLLEQVRALEETAHRLATERDVARQMASEATKDLVRARHQIHIADVVNTALRADLNEARIELRRTREICRGLAAAKGALELQIDRMQNPPEPRPDDHTRRWPFKRVGNAL